MRKIGAHVSASGGLDQAVIRAAEIGANCLQLFSGSPRIWQKKNLGQFDLSKLTEARKKYRVDPIFTHALYLVNLASDKLELVKKSSESLIYELKFDALIHGSGVIIHAGSHQGRGWLSVQHQVIEQIKLILENTPNNSTLLIENAAGQKGKLHGNLTDIKWTLDQLPEFVNNNRLGWCFDTCHAYAAGYQLGQQENNVIEQITQLNLWPALKCIHVNDSRDDAASGRDRHANIGDGLIPQEDLKYFLNYSQVIDLPLITEVPGINGDGPDKENILRIKKITHS